MHVVVVGGGGGGSGSLSEGMGGPGGASGAVVTGSVLIKIQAIAVQVGQNGAGGSGFEVPGNSGMPSQFGNIVAAGGGGGQTNLGGSTPIPGGSSGGGGSGGGYLADSPFHPGSGGSGGSAGSNGQAGQNSTDPQNTVLGLAGGNGATFPKFDFSAVTVSAGTGGAGGRFGTGSNGFPQIFGGGGGGGGGILLSGEGPTASAGNDKDCSNCLTGVPGQSGRGGVGYGSGGGGLGNGVNNPAGNGAPGVVYVEW